MATVSRKHREIQEREALILGVARDMLVTDGYLGMTMDRIATACEYSKGTIYNHFHNKEEVVAALGVQTMNRRTDLFARASNFSGNTRERMMAVGVALELFVRLYPKDFRALSVVQASSIRAKTSPERQHELQACDNRCMSIVTDIVQDAIAQGELVLPADSTAEQVTFGLWSLNYGAYTLMASDIPLDELGIKEPFDITHANSHRLLDGYSWKPLSDTWDYEETEQRVFQEIFRDEYQRLQRTTS